MPSSDKMVSMITNDIKNKLTKYFVRGFDSSDLIILIPTRYFNVLVGYIEVVREKPTDTTEIKNSIWGIETKSVNDLDDIYVSLK